MSSAQILVLGGVAGSTIFLGLPVGRMQSVSPRVKSFLSAAATGILLFLIWDVLSAAVDPVESALKSGRDARFFGLAALLAVGFGIGLLSLEQRPDLEHSRGSYATRGQISDLTRSAKLAKPKTGQDKS